ncbi:MAG: 50S ribosomal protein L21 [Acidobacteria bacterium]|nr:50S ribosomal protein L21 [Acidobacteriota bacterium]MYC81480.1 50S ribosomal protein L21 [Acidobacteriota bacterium]
MYAVIKAAGKQYRVTPGEIVRLDKMEEQVGDQVEFDKVLAIQDEEQHTIGRPTIDKARVLGTVVETGRAKKIRVLKFKRRKQYRVLRGHRQDFTAVKIDAIKTESQEG